MKSHQSQFSLLRRLEEKQHATQALRFNRPLPALELCDDILETIFLLGAAQEVEPHSRRKTVLLYAQVCQDWRKAALTMRRLWIQLADFDFMPWAWNEEILRRSSPLPVAIGSCTWHPRAASVVAKELAHLERVEAYKLRFTSSTWNALVQGLQQPAQSLQCLSLAHVSEIPLFSRDRSPHPHHEIGRFILPSTTFSHHAPNLRRLKLEGCFIDPSTPFLCQLTSLCVVDIDFRYNTAPTVPEWADLLEKMPSLVHLSLKSAISPSTSILRPRKRRRTRESSDFLERTPSPDLPAPQHEHKKKITLEHLKRLHVDGPLSEVAALVEVVGITGACELHIGCSDCHPGDDLEKVQRIWVRQLLSSLDSLQDGDSMPMIPLSLNSSSTRLCVRSDAELMNSPAVSKPPTLFSQQRQHLSSFYIEMRIAQDLQWEILLPSMLSAMCNSSDRYGVNASGLVSFIQYLYLGLPSPHLDLIPFLSRATNVDSLLCVSGSLCGWLLEELRFVGYSEAGYTHTAQPLDQAGYPRFPLLPQLRVLTFGDDRCLYGLAWKSLEGLVQARAAKSSHDSPEPPISTVNHEASDGYELYKTSPLQLVAFSGHLPHEKRQLMIDLGIVVDILKSERC